jgi:NADH-quinone oxidoreductase subunit L
MAEGVHNYSAGIFHLSTHAYFKALLFLGAGAVIHALNGEQDMRQMGGLRSRLPIAFWTFVIAALAISGIPPFAGFWSKDEILSSLLAQANANHNPWSYILWGVGLLTAGLTAFYMFRLVFGIFAGTYRGAPVAKTHEEEEEADTHHGGKVDYYAIHEAPSIMTVPLILLAIFSVIGGLVGSFGLFGRPSWQPFAALLAPVFTGVATPEASLSLQWISTGISIGLGLLGILLAVAIYRRGFQYKENPNPLYQLVFHKYYVDEVLTLVLIQPILWIGREASRWLEGGMLDGGSRGLAWLLRGTSDLLRRLQTGYMRNYALAILVGVVLIIVYYAVRG